MLSKLEDHIESDKNWLGWENKNINEFDLKYKCQQIFNFSVVAILEEFWKLPGVGAEPP